MSNPSIQIQLPALAPSLRWLQLQGARLQQALRRAGRALWLALEAQGEANARRELLRLAAQWQHSNPKLARELRSYARGGSSY